MMSVPDFQPSQFNTSLRQAKWNDDAVIKCDRSNGDVEYFSLDAKEITTFSSNESLLLGSFTCEKIVIGDMNSVSDLDDDWSVDVDILEFDDDYRKARSLLKSKAQLQSTKITIHLPKPVLIRPGLFYKISMGPFPKGYQYYSRELKMSVELGGRIALDFYEIDCLISALHFNRI